MPLIERRVSARNDPAFLLAILYTVGFFAFVLSILLRDIPALNKELVSQILPVLSMIQGGIVQYFYNKSAQTQRTTADETIKQLATATATTAETAKKVTDATIPSNTGTVKTDTVNMDADTVNLTEKK